VRTVKLCFVKLLIIPYRLNDKSLGRTWSYYEYTLIIRPLKFRGYCTYHQVIIIFLNSIKRSVFVKKSLCVCLLWGINWIFVYASHTFSRSEFESNHHWFFADGQNLKQFYVYRVLILYNPNRYWLTVGPLIYYTTHWFAPMLLIRDLMTHLLSQCEFCVHNAEYSCPQKCCENSDNNLLVMAITATWPHLYVIT